MAKRRKKRTRPNYYKKRTRRSLRSLKAIRPDNVRTTKKFDWRATRDTSPKAVNLKVERVEGEQKQRKPRLSTTVLTNTNKHKNIVCTRRAQRKQIIHAKGYAGKSGQTKFIDNSKRNIKCL